MSGIIHTSYGDVEGFRHNGCRVWLGIPFAKAPTGRRHPALCLEPLCKRRHPRLDSGQNEDHQITE